MSYNPSIPLVTDSTLQSFSQIKANFTQIDAAFANNHVGLTSTSDNIGKHNLLLLRPQTSDPTTSANEVALYNKLVTAVPQLFYMPNNAQTPIQMTYASLQTGLQSTNPDVYFLRQYSFVAGPFVIYGGLIKAAADQQVVILTPTSTLIFVDLTVTNPQTNQPNTRIDYAVPTNIGAGTFTINYFNPPIVGTIDIFYFAIGV